MNFCSWETFSGAKRGRHESYDDDDNDDDDYDTSADAELALQLALEEFDELQSHPQSSSSSKGSSIQRESCTHDDPRESAFRRRLLRTMEARASSSNSLASLPSPSVKGSFRT